MFNYFINIFIPIIYCNVYFKFFYNFQMFQLLFVVLHRLSKVFVSFLPVEFYLRPSGRINLRLNEFTFYQHLKARSNAHRWSCTAYGSKWKCKAHLIITDKLEVLKANLVHSHPPRNKKSFHKPIFTMRKGAMDNDENLPVPVISDMHTVSSLHDYFMAHSVFNNY